MSPTLFGLFINDLVAEVNKQNLGIKVGNLQIAILLFADDIVLMAESEQKLQSLLNVVHKWCLINISTFMYLFVFSHFF